MFSKYRDKEFAESKEWGSKEEFAAAYKQHMTEKYGALGPIAMLLIQIAIEFLWRKIQL